jgi:Fe-S-cluster formation regulator IscX/YfhJ
MSDRNVRSVVTRVLDLGSRRNEPGPVQPVAMFSDRLRIHGEYVEPVEGKVLIVGPSRDREVPRWRCFACNSGGEGVDDLIRLAIPSHLVECYGDVDVARVRFTLLRALIEEGQESYDSDDWNKSVVKSLLLDGGVWTLVAEKVGWPVGVYGVDGWDVSLDDALDRHGLTRSDIFRR